MQTLERFRGHYFNWYDTLTLQVLPPRYISTVDSGNLASHLLVLRQGLLAMPYQKILSTQSLEGLRDTAALLEKEMKDGVKLRQFKKDLALALAKQPLTLADAKQALERLVVASTNIAVGHDIDRQSEVYKWAEALTRQIQGQLENLFLLTPWILLPPAPWGLADLQPPDIIPTLYELTEIEAAWAPQIERRLAAQPDFEQKLWLSRLRESLPVRAGLPVSR